MRAARLRKVGLWSLALGLPVLVLDFRSSLHQTLQRPKTKDQLPCIRCQVAGTRSNDHILAFRCDFNLSVVLVAILVERIVAKQILSSQLGGNPGKGIRKRDECVCSQEPTA